MPRNLSNVAAEAGEVEAAAFLSALFAPGAVVMALRGRGDSRWLSAAEDARLARAVPKRREEFAAGRRCAKRALQVLGIDECEIGSGHDRQPLWPPDIVGSITHTEGFCAAVVARQDARLWGLGIDSEVAGRVKPELWRAILMPAEQQWLDTVSAEQRAAAATLIFAAKEAFYKSQYPRTGTFIGFKEATLTVHQWPSQSGAFEVSLPERAELLTGLEVQGRYLLHEGFVTAAATLSRKAPQ